MHETRTFILLLCPTAVLSSSVSNIGPFVVFKSSVLCWPPPPLHIADSGASFFIGLLYINILPCLACTCYALFCIVGLSPIFRVLLVLVMLYFVLLVFPPSSVFCLYLLCSILYCWSFPHLPCFACTCYALFCIVGLSPIIRVLMMAFRLLCFTGLSCSGVSYVGSLDVQGLGEAEDK